ncbi:MAG: transcriptional repressor [Anaerolineae bacterium]
MTHHTVDYASLIRESGGRLTTQREMILDAICAGGSHNTPESIYQRVQAQAPDIALSTVYRALDFLCEVGLVACSLLDDGTRVYEIAAGRPTHYHLICQGCGRDIEVSPALFESAFEAIRQRYNFLVSPSHLMLSGFCADCLAAQQQRKTT